MKRILIADDDSGILDSLLTMLKFEGYDVTTTLNGSSILMMDELPDLLLLDIWMSGTDGRAVCRQLKADERTRHIPVVMISASKDVEQSAREAGADDFIAKPFDMNLLLTTIARNIK